MSMGHEKLRGLFIKRAEDGFAEAADRVRKDELEAMAAEFEGELLDENSDGIAETEFEDGEADDLDPPIVDSISLPPDFEVMSQDENGEPLSYFGDQVWYKIDKTGIHKPFYFGEEMRSSKIDFYDPMTAPLQVLQKLLLYSFWPGKDLTLRPYTVSSLNSFHHSHNDLLGWLRDNGYLLSDDIKNSPPTVDLVTAKVLKDEIRRRATSDEGIHTTLSFTRAIKGWVNLGDKPYCPAWLRPKFEYKDVMDRALAKEVAQQMASKTSRWEAIPFEDLEKLIRMTQRYVKVYAKDLFWLESKHHKAYKDCEAEQLNTYPATRGVFDEVTNYSFAENPDTGLPWFEVEVGTYVDKDRGPMYQYVGRASINREINTLVGAAIFILLTFTGMRHEEMLHLLVDALRINGEPLDYFGDVFAQVEAGTSFNLSRRVFKTNKGPTGKTHVAPIPKIAALSFAVLIEAFREGRKKVDTDYLLSAGGVMRPWSTTGNVMGRKTVGSLAPYLQVICNASDTKYHHAHKCRKTLATLLINHDPDSLEVIRYLLDHNSITMTYEYLMALPGINEEVYNHMVEQMKIDLANILADTLEGKAAGGGGNKGLDSVLKNIEAWKGERIGQNTEILIEAYKQSNFFIHRTPAAWCVRHPSQVPRTAPCLPKVTQEAIMNGEIIDGSEITVEPEHCIPWKCGDAWHTTDDLDMAKRSAKYASEKANSGGPKAQQKHYQEQAEYWSEVVHQLQYGRPDVAGLHLLESYLGGGA